MKKQYETPKMNSIDFEYKTSLLAGSCNGEPSGVSTFSGGDLSLDLGKIDNDKA